MIAGRRAVAGCVIALVAGLVAAVNGSNAGALADVPAGVVDTLLISTPSQPPFLGDHESYWPTLSGDGTVVAYVTTEPAYSDERGTPTVVALDLVTGETTVVAVGRDGQRANGRTSAPTLDDDGRRIAFTSTADNLVEGDTNRQQDVVVADLETGQLTSLTSHGSGPSYRPSISGSGDHVVFESDAANLTSDPDLNADRDVFVAAADGSSIERVSVSVDGSDANGHSFSASISDDGSVVAFRSDASNLVEDDLGAGIFVRDLSTSTTKRLATDRNIFPTRPHLSGDGRFVAYGTRGRRGGEAPGAWLYDRETAEQVLVSVSTTGVRATSFTDVAGISDDGARVVLQSSDRSLAGRLGTPGTKTFVRDIGQGSTIAVPVLSSTLRPAASDTRGVTMSDDGHSIVFASRVPILDTDTDGLRLDVYMSRLGTLDPGRMCLGLDPSIVGSGEIAGTDAADVILGSDGSDVIEGGSGADIICSGAGDDVVRSGFGDDEVIGGPGADTIIGGPGDDFLASGQGDDTLRGRDGNDRIDGGEGVDDVGAGDGNDWIVGHGDSDTLRGGTGRDTVDYSANESGVVVRLGGRVDGDDSIVAIEQVIGSPHDDLLIGSVNADQILAGDGDDIVRGGPGDDVLAGNDGDDSLQGNGGDDVIAGWSGNDSVIGGPGADRLSGDDDDDRVIGGPGDDSLRGGSGDDYCRGSAGTDRFSSCETADP